MTLAQDERRNLVDLMREVGPDAPTLCGGWTTRDLAAHLILRERRFDAAGGILVPALRARTQRVQDQIAAGEWDTLLRDLAAGPPRWSPLRPLDSLVNGLEFFAHHEDVRRGRHGWQPRAFGADEHRALLKLLPMAQFNYRRAPVRVELTAVDGPTVVANRRRPNTVRLTGAVSELLLHSVGRDAVIVATDGAPADVAALEAANRSI
jgi:uncharacterized protein (TIGR03085 family)